MLPLLVALALIFIVFLINFWYNKVTRIHKKLDWIVKVPGYPICGNVFDFTDSTSFLTTLSNYAKKYGKSFYMQIGIQNIIIVTDYKLLEFILSSNKIIDKSENYRFAHSWLGTGLLTSSGKKWKTHRKIITPTFHFQILEQFVEVFETNGKILVEKLKKEVDKDCVDIYPYITLCSLDIICETAMGTSINAQDGKSLDYIQAVKDMCRLVVVRAFSATLMFDLIYHMSSEYKKEVNALKILHNRSNSVIAKRRVDLENADTKGQDEDDIGARKKIPFLDSLLTSNEKGRKLTDEEIREEVDTIMFEGHDTTTSAISFALYCIASNPQIQDKIVQEQKEVYGDDLTKTVTFRDLQSMKYLEAVIKEALRMYPSVPFYGRAVMQDTEYEGKIIPKGVSLLIYAYGVNNDPDHFPNPDVFDPSRFESNDGRNPFSYLPFSAGPRNCVGQKYAMLEMKSTISRIIRFYELLPVPDYKPILAAETVLKSLNGINVRLRSRKWN